MSDATSIEWTDATWQPITGCSVLSKGCTNCYAMRLAGGRLRHHPSRAGLTRPSAAGPVWTGEVRFNHEWIGQPQGWRAPRQVFVCAHGDLWHGAVPDAWIDDVFAVMAETPWHTFQVLTKRAQRMRRYLSSPDVRERIDAAALALAQRGSIRILLDPECRWPLANVHVGVSVEDQESAQERVPDLLHAPAALRWISAEPLLGAIRLDVLRCNNDDQPQMRRVNAVESVDALRGQTITTAGFGYDIGSRIGWVVAGGESGPGARPMDVEWARSLRDQCAAAGTAFFMKQLGGAHDKRGLLADMPDDLRIRDLPHASTSAGTPIRAAGAEKLRP